MKALYRLALALTVATAALLAPVAHAQSPDEFEFRADPTPLTLRYQDNDGAGRLEVVLQGFTSHPFPGRALYVTLRQGGNAWSGPGIASNRGDRLTFWLAGYVFDGTWQGSYYQGEYYDQFGNDIDTWFVS